jgi:hypothetical protein
MSLPTTIPQAVLDTVLNRLALLFLAAAGDPATARQAAAQLLAAYHAETPDELSLASEIISFGLHALEALSYASDPELSLNSILRLRGSAVSLSREQHKAQRQLDRLQRARAQHQPAETSPTPPRPQAEKALGLVETVREATQAATKTGGKIPWSQAYQKRQLVARMAENAKKNQAKHASQTAHLNAIPANTQPAHPAG